MNLRPRHPRRSVRVDLTPLIDVVFLLLIFFMVSTTFDKETRLKVELPQAQTQPQEQRPPERVEIAIDARGRFYLNERELIRSDAETLRATLRKVSDGRDLPIVVRVDRSAPFQAPMTLMDVAAGLGLTRLSFVADQAPGQGD